jgi:hypothetical protein
MTSASLLIVLLVGTAVGAVVGLLLGSMDTFYLAVIAGFVAVVVAAVARNVILARGAELGPDESSTPILVIVYLAVASIAGGALAQELALRSEVAAPVWVGALAGLFSAILAAMLLITYHTNPGQPPMLRSKR